MSEITWATDELREQMLSALAEANLRPDECEAHPDEGAWIALHKYAFQTNVVVNYEAKGFIVEDSTTGYAQGVESVEAYKALWVSINGKWEAEVSVWVISFEVVNNG